MSYVPLAGPSDLEQLFAQTAQTFEAGLQELRAGTVAGCEKLRKNASWLARSQTNEVCDRLLQTVDQNIAILSKKDSAGVPFYLRKPAEAQRLLRVARANSIELLEDHKKRLIEGGFVPFGSEWSGDVFVAFLGRAFDQLQTVLQALLQASAKNPLAALAIGGAAALALWILSRRLL